MTWTLAMPEGLSNSLNQGAPMRSLSHQSPNNFLALALSHLKGGEPEQRIATELALALRAFLQDWKGMNIDPEKEFSHLLD